jgi:hypothetical protein
MSSRLQLEVNVVQDFALAESGADSPRSKIAERLKGLDIRPWDVPPPVFKPMSRDSSEVSSEMREESSFSPRKRQKSLCSKDDPREEKLEGFPLHIEIAETPVAHRPVFSPVSVRPIRESIELSPSNKAKRLHPLPSPSAMDSSDDDVTGYIHRLDRAAQTWKDSEITGHDIDKSGDDDGEGINGIGFRPTPAMEYARRQKRRQQISEWKTREARDARQRRIERRRGGGRDRSSSGENFERMEDMRPARRVVRFV